MKKETKESTSKTFLFLTVIGCIIFTFVLGANDLNNTGFGVLISIVIIYLVAYRLYDKPLTKMIKAVKKDTSKMKVFSDKSYLEAYSEVEEDNIQNKELWAKAFAQCGGDKEKQKSIYVELRTKELSKR